MEEINNSKELKAKKPFIIKWFKRFFVAVLVIIVALLLLLQTAAVQTWLISKVTDYISKATNTTVSAERIKISPFEGLILNNLNIVDKKQDTLLHAGAVNVSLRKNIFFILYNELDLSYIGVKDIVVNIKTELGDSKSNFTYFLENLPSSSSKEGQMSNPIAVKLKEIDFGEIFVLINNKNKGNYDKILLKSGNIDIKYMDLECKQFDINSILFDGPVFQRHIYEYGCGISDELSIPQNIKHQEDSKLTNQPYTVSIGDFAVRNGYFGKSNALLTASEQYKSYLDYNNFYFNKINLIVSDIKLRDNILSAKIDGINASDNTGYRIENIKSDTLTVSNERAELASLSMEFGKTKIFDQFSLSYADLSDLSDFTRNVILNANLQGSEIYLDDLTHFVRGLEKVTFFKNNKKETVNISGRYFGRINNLAGRDVDIKLGNKLSLSGSFNTRDLLDADNTVLNVRLDRFSTSMRKLKMLLPQFNPPQNFNKLGSINFTGRFDGYLEDFVAYGKLASDIGSAEVDMRLDVTRGQDKANYSGTMNLSNFNLGIWSDNSDLGIVNFRSKVVDGRGLTLNTVKAELQARVNSLIFKKYNYKDFILDGVIDNNTFNGSFKIEDKNIDFVFDGSVEYLNKKAFLSFKSDVKNLDLYALNLSKVPMSFQARMNIDIAGSNINDFTGDIDISDLFILSNDTSYQLNTLQLSSKNTVKNTRLISMQSDLGTVMMDGQYDILNIVKSAKNILSSNYPHITRTWTNQVAENVVNQKFDFNFQFKDSRNFLSLLGLKDSYFSKLSLKGRIDTYKNEISLASEIPRLRIKDDSLVNLQILVTTDKKAGDIYIHVDSTYAIGRRFNPIDFQTKMKGDTIDFTFASERLLDSLESFDIRGRLIPHSLGYNLNLADNLLVLLGAKWKINPKNNIIFGKEYLQFDNMNITDGVRNIEINDINKNRGLSIDITNINLDIVNKLSKYEKMNFAGNSNISARIQDFYSEEKEVSGYVNIPQFTINGDPYGAIFIDVLKIVRQPYNVNITVGDFIAIKGSYNDVAKEIDSRIKIRQAPLKILEYLLKAGIKNTSGFINGDVVFGGPLSNLNISGDGVISKGKTSLIFTGATYFFDNQKIKLNNTAIDLDGIRISDVNGSIGTVRGGLTHKMFKNFGVNATISGNNVVGLNTTKADNPNYYGYGVGPVSAEFKGPFSKVNMKINATTGPGTKLFIPVGNTQSAIDQNFIRFVKKENQITVEEKSFAVEGVSVEMSLTLTPDAEVSLIFNESKGDIIRGTGRGNMKIDITREGDFEIFGNYEIEQGQYLFTVALLPVAKPFVVQRGGIISWTGDPVNATLNITAKYRARTSVEPFIAEYLTLANPADQRLAGQNTEVDLQLKLGGTLYKPEIKFDLAFPNLTGDIANFADSKLRIIRNNELELNGQAMGLIVFNSFLPSNRLADAFGASGIKSASINTLSEFVTSQLSVYITNILNSIVNEGGLISGIDFDVNVRNNNFGIASSNVLPDEIAIRNTFVFKNNRLSLDIGGNYVFQNQGITINQVLPDFALEFQLTEDRKLKVRLYGKYDIDPITITGLREKYGLGVAYRTEFGSMTDFEKKIKKVALETIHQ